MGGNNALTGQLTSGNSDTASARGNAALVNGQNIAGLAQNGVNAFAYMGANRTPAPAANQNAFSTYQTYAPSVFAYGS